MFSTVTAILYNIEFDLGKQTFTCLLSQKEFLKYKLPFNFLKMFMTRTLS